MIAAEAYWRRDSARMARLKDGAPFRWIRAAEHEVFAVGNGIHDRFAEPVGVEYEVVFPIARSSDSEVVVTDICGRDQPDGRLRVSPAKPPRREPVEHKIARLPALERVEEPVASRVFIKQYDPPVYKPRVYTPPVYRAHSPMWLEEIGALCKCSRCGKYFDGGSGAVCTAPAGQYEMLSQSYVPQFTR